MRVKLKNACLIDAYSDFCGDLYYEEGLITYCGPPVDISFDKCLDLNGLVLMPAFIDMHCHLRDPGQPEKEDMQTGMAAALKGGYATLLAMANTDPVIESPELVLLNQKKAQELKLCRLIQAAAAGQGLKDKHPTQRRALSLLTPMLSNDGKTIFNDAFMRQLLLDSAELGVLISTHCQPELEIVKRDLALIKETGGNLHIGHISKKETVEAIREAKQNGLKLTCEVTPHHLFGCDDPYLVNPPLRSQKDVIALIGGIKDRTIDCLSTDHAPHTEADKSAGAAGISNIEYAIQIFLYVFKKNNLPLTRLSEMLSLAPAKRLGLNLGLLKAGLSADLVVLEPEGIHEISKADMISKSHNTPFDGREVCGRVCMTIVGGETRYEYGQALRRC